MTFIKKPICRAKPPQRGPQNPHLPLSLAGKTMELNTGKTGKDGILQNSPFPNPTERSLGGFWEQPGRWNPAHPPNPETNAKHREAKGKRREQHNQLNQLEITEESSQGAKLEVDVVRSLELLCAMSFLGWNLL